MASQWGRKETVIWPPQVPVYTIGTLILAVPIVMCLLLGMYFTKPFLAREYTGDFLKSAARAQFKMHNSFRLIFLQGGKKAPRVAQHRRTSFPAQRSFRTARSLSVQLSPAASTCRGIHQLSFSAPETQDGRRRPCTGGSGRRSSVGTTCSAPTVWQSAEAAGVVIFLLCFAVPLDFKRRQEDEVWAASARAGHVGHPSSSTGF